MGANDRILILTAVVVIALLLPTIWVQTAPTKYLLSTIRQYRADGTYSKEAKVFIHQAKLDESDNRITDGQNSVEEAAPSASPPPRLIKVPSPPILYSPYSRQPPPKLPGPPPSLPPPSPSPAIETASKTSSLQETTASPSSLALDPNAPTFLEALAECTTLECVREAHELPRGPATFNFPHAMIIGFQKSATTSTYVYLKSQLNVLPPSVKEPEFFTYDCAYKPPSNCPADLTKKYLTRTLPMKDFIASNGTMLTYEGSTHLVRSGPGVARGIRKSMPWLKLVVAMREPISRAASMLVHTKTSGKGCLYHKKSLELCLSTKSQISGGELGHANNYYDNIRVWLEEWPEEQVHVIQYEELTEKENTDIVLTDLLKYVGLPEKGRNHLRLVNTRRFDIRPKGWPMRYEVYSKLVDMVRKDTEKLLDLLEAHNRIKDRDAWMSRWEAVWTENLSSCSPEGDCNILLS